MDKWSDEALVEVTFREILQRLLSQPAVAEHLEEHLIRGGKYDLAATDKMELLRALGLVLPQPKDTDRVFQAVEVVLKEMTATRAGVVAGK